MATKDESVIRYNMLVGKLAIKAVGDNELDLTAVPFFSRDEDQQWFDEDTDIMQDAFKTPVIAYQHGIEQGSKGRKKVNWQPRPIVIGKTVPDSLRQEPDGWHLNAILDAANKLTEGIIKAAKIGAAAVSSGTIDHLARLEVDGKLIRYVKEIPGRIAVWPLGEVSIWELGNGNFNQANRFAIAVPAMKAIYRDAGIPFPEIDSVDSEAGEAKKQDILRKAREYLANIKE